jgi:hypothetical protein
MEDRDNSASPDTPSAIDRVGESGSSLGHKRSLSGSILSTLSFLRSAADDSKISPTTLVTGASTGSTSEHSPLSLGTPPSPLAEQKKTRKRKGSLRKTALLGTGKLKSERRGSNMETSRSISAGQRKQSTFDIDGQIKENSPLSPLEKGGSRRFGFENIEGPLQMRSSYGKGSFHPDVKPDGALDRGSRFATFQGSKDTSTTDEEEGLLVAKHGGISQLTKKPGAASLDYFPLQDGSIQRRRSSNKAKSPLSTFAVDAAGSPDDWDYAATEWWGWVVLIVTWIVFVIGMGSCFEVWSWAWDVGETPYAPPELEDDPTLPIVGYYPALIILTAVMAWVWVVIAWMGMKYFKHAKISGDEI